MLQMENPQLRQHAGWSPDLQWRAKRMFSPQSKWLHDELFYNVRFERSDSAISLIASVSEQYKQTEMKQNVAF